MPEQLLHGADVVPVLRQVGRKGVAKRVAARLLPDPGQEDGIVDGSVDDRFIDVEPALPALPARASVLRL